MRGAEDPVHAEFAGDRAGVLPTRAAKGHEGVRADILAAGGGELLDRSDHRGVGDAEKTGGEIIAGGNQAVGGGDPGDEFVQAGLDGGAGPA